MRSGCWPAIRCDDPVLFLEHQAPLSRAFGPAVPRAEMHSIAKQSRARGQDRYAITLARWCRAAYSGEKLHRETGVMSI